MKYSIYKTTNLINNKIYVGYHASENLNDSYLGSGLLILKAIEKYGKENFKKEILYIFPTKAEALLKEAEIVDEKFVERKDTYNCKIGGEGGWDHIPQMIKEDKEFRKCMYSKISNSLKQAYKRGDIKGWHEYTSGMLGKTQTEKTKKLISKNNGNKLSDEIIKQRINDFVNINRSGEKGKISRLAEKWGISHTTVKRFIQKYC